MKDDMLPQQGREAAYHDRLAEKLSAEETQVEEFFSAITALENRFILSHMGSLQGKSVLDLGCGAGEAAVNFARRGAAVWVCDLSPKMTAFAIELGRRHGVVLRGEACPAERLAFDDGMFDFVYLNGVLHHVSDRAMVYRELRRVLRPGGRFYAVEPLAGNPVINIYRRMATCVRSQDETPLTLAELRALREFFPHVGHREFWLASLVLFGKYYLIDRIHPNAARYWRLIYNETERTLWWWRPFQFLDRWLTRLPLLRRLCWNMVVWGGERPRRVSGGAPQVTSAGTPGPCR